MYGCTKYTSHVGLLLFVNWEWPVELFITIFRSHEAGIAEEIFQLQMTKNIYIFKINHFSKK